jgi:hypothetical protein
MYPTIKDGDTGETVKVWQTVLGPPIKVDGIFGPNTKAATIEWQKRYDLIPSGIVDAQTWAKVSSTSEDRTQEETRVSPLGIFAGMTVASVAGLAGIWAFKFFIKAVR